MKWIFTGVLIIVANSLAAQSAKAFIKKNAIKIARPGSLDNLIYGVLSRFKLVMVGEMHGTTEPAKFVKGLVQLFTRKPKLLRRPKW